MLACVGTWRNQNVRQREQFMQGLVPVAIIARVKNLDDLIEAHQEIQGSNGGIATANALRLLHVQAAIKQHHSGSLQVALHNLLKQQHAVNQQRTLHVLLRSEEHTSELQSRF